ncbi:MAG: radical SAM family heme chaperone HemW [Nitrospinota bacterium]|nr:radical SAM family heme chaperone HemW [Nitrospinota bacterium]MDH5756178.1 radical SAM family heme chaperone HemW [Nitrospinota bacterium]
MNRGDDYGVYIHIPFCESKCMYCDFYSTDAKGGLTQGYVKAVSKEVEALAELVEGRRAASIFIGGGTPSLLSESMTAGILEACFKHLSLAQEAEITLEANPESLTAAKTAGYKRAGVNRLSIGIQSLNDRWLKSLGRIHNSLKAKRAVSSAREVGFDNVSADMIFGLQDQTVQMWLEDLANAMALDLDHISCYQLTPEKGTKLGRIVELGEVELPAETLEYFDQTEKMLKSAGYTHYEISNYAKKGRQCVHNLGYWHYRDYLGIGSAAHGMVNGARWANVRDPARYVSRINSGGLGALRNTTISDEMKQTERLMLGLRLKRGISMQDVRTTPGMEAMVEQGMLIISRGRIRASARGWRMLDSVLASI